MRQQFILVTYTQSRERRHCMPCRATQGSTWKQSEPAGLWQAGFVVTRGLGDPWFSWRMWFTFLIISLDCREEKPVGLKIRWDGAGLADREAGLGGIFSCWVGWGSYLASAEHTRRPLGPQEAPRCQGSTWNFSPYNIVLMIESLLREEAGASRTSGRCGGRYCWARVGATAGLWTTKEMRSADCTKGKAGSTRVSTHIWCRLSQGATKQVSGVQSRRCGSWGNAEVGTPGFHLVSSYFCFLMSCIIVTVSWGGWNIKWDNNTCDPFKNINY